MTKTPRVRVFEERTETREIPDGIDPDAENPYWQEDEPHPNPELGCIRRGICCRSNPGWFAPGEAEQAAELLGLTPDEMVRKHLVIDSIQLDDEWVDVFVPVKLGRDNKPLLPPATRVDDIYRLLRSPCTFYDGEGCRIYGARPAECRAYVCTNAPEENLSHKAIGQMWRDAQDRQSETDSSS